MTPLIFWGFFHELGGSFLISDFSNSPEDGLTVHGKPLRDHLEAVGCAKAIDLMFEMVSRKRPLWMATVAWEGYWPP